jgi:homoserine O-acetyltransferase/O-succinyltransferase
MPEPIATQIFELGDFQLTSGITLPQAKLSYKTYGTLNAAKDNAIVFPHFLGGAPAALEIFIEEGRPLDPSKYLIVLPGLFGAGVSSSPSNTAPPFDRGAFPQTTIADDVIAQHRLVTEVFGIEQLHLVLGWSVGALQTYEWAVRFPEMVKRAASIAGAPKPSPWTTLWLQTAIEEPLTADPAWNNGFYNDPRDLQAGLRHQGHIMALTLPPLGFYREGEEVWRSIGFSSRNDFIARFWEAFMLPQDPNDLVTQSRKTRTADPSAGGDLDAALQQIKAKMFTIAFNGDMMFPPEECQRDAQRIPNAQYREVNSISGHLTTFALTQQDKQAMDDILQQVLTS